MFTISNAFAYLCLVVIMSCACFVAYGYDKRQAVGGGRRVPEKTLHTLALLGGWPGALIGQRYYRHKTQKVSFLVVFWITVVAHVAAVAALALGFVDLSIIDAIGYVRP